MVPVMVFTNRLFAHTVLFTPAFTTGGSTAAKRTFTVSALQLPKFAIKNTPDVRIVFSNALGVYRGFKSVLLGVKVPPEPAQYAVAPGGPKIVPFNRMVSILRQKGAPLAVIEGLGVNVSFIEEVTLVHPAFTAVRVKVTPLVVSGVDGLYVEVKEAGLLKQATQPLEEVQEKEVKLVTVPANVAVVLFLQSAWSGPAIAVGAGVIVSVIVFDTLVQPAELSENVRITLPLVLSVEEGL